MAQKKYGVHKHPLWNIYQLMKYRCMSPSCMAYPNYGGRRAQANNTRQVRLLELNGVKKSVSEWARYLGIKRSALNARLNDYGWPVERALTVGVRLG